MPFVARKITPPPGHKCVGAYPAVVVHCECGWASCPHSGETARTEAYSEWRDHAAKHGGTPEPIDKWFARQDREEEKLKRLYGGESAHV